MGSSGAAETSAEGVCVLTVAAELVNVAVGPVYGEADDAVVVQVGGLDVVVVIATGEGGVTGATVTGALMPVRIKCVLAETSEMNEKCCYRCSCLCLLEMRVRILTVFNVDAAMRDLVQDHV